MNPVSISVVCPTYNSETFIETTLKTVFNQSHCVDELLVCDDGSTDNTVRQVKRICNDLDGKIKYRVLVNSHQGPGATRNSGIKAAESEWIAFLDSDDVWESDKIKRIVEVIDANPDVNFICHNEYKVNKKGEKSLLDYGVRYQNNKPLIEQVYHANMFSTSTIVCKRSLLLECGLFNEDLMSAQDYELWLRLSPYINVCFLQEVLGNYIEREGNITSGNLFKRFKNELKIAFMHRNLVSFSGQLKRVARIMLSYIRQFIKRFVNT